MGCRRGWVAVGILGIAGTAAAQTGAPASSAGVPPPASAGAAAPGAAPPSAPPPAAPPSAAPASPSAAPAPGATAPPPPGAAPYPPYPYPYPPYPYPPPYYPWPPPEGAEPPKDKRPRTLPYVGGKPPPPGYHVESGVRRGPVIAGSIMFGTTYGLQALIASSVDFEDDTEWLLVPVLGSWVFMSRACDRGNDDGCSFLAIHGLTQTAGAVLLIYGLASKSKRYVRDDLGLQLAPVRIGTGYGFSASGRF